jgi:hypothetical protein
LTDLERLLQILKFRYERLRGVSGRIQNALGELASMGEKLQSLLSWRDPRYVCGRAISWDFFFFFFLVFCSHLLLLRVQGYFNIHNVLLGCCNCPLRHALPSGSGAAGCVHFETSAVPRPAAFGAAKFLQEATLTGRPHLVVRLGWLLVDRHKVEESSLFVYRCLSPC